MHMTDNRPILKKGDYEVIVVGGGIAGVAAAVAAARCGAQTLLLEKSIVLGGLATAGLISWYEPLCDGAGQKMIGGIAEELIRLSIRYGFGNLPVEWKEGVMRTEPPKRMASLFSPTLFAMALDEYLRENHVELVLDCLASYPVMAEKRCCGIVAEVKEGRAFYGADMVVDATGDASVFHAAGAPTVDGQNFMSFVAHGVDVQDIEAFSQTGSMLSMRKWMKAGSDMNGSGHPEGMPLSKGLTSEDITDFVLTGRRLLFEKLKAQPADARDVSMLPFMPQFRTIRRIVGKLDFNAVDRQAFPRSIGSSGDFRKEIGKGKHFHIPYEALYNEAFPNLFAAGRIISAPWGDGWEIARVIPTCALTGQAAGVAAALCLKHKTDADALPYPALFEALKEQSTLWID